MTVHSGATVERMTMMATPDAEVEVDDATVRALLADQHPDLASLPLGARVEGWDNVTIRLGGTLAVRLPRRALGAEIAVTELEWLPRIGTHWTFPAPVPRRIGEPGHGYPWRWSVVPWIEGDSAYEAPLSVDGASDLGRALAGVHVSAPGDAPRNPYRSLTLSERAEVFGERLGHLEATGAVADAARLRAQFGAAAAAPPGPTTWTHLDLHGHNVLTRRGRLAGILDWGDAAAGSPTTDLGQAAVLVGAIHVAPMLDAYLGACEPQVAAFVGSASGRRLMRAEAVHYAATLACIEDDPYRSAGTEALASLRPARA